MGVESRRCEIDIDICLRKLRIWLPYSKT
jgi:hypothetical protein